MPRLSLTVIALFMLLAVPAVGADLQKGYAAHRNGDYTTALSELRPLAAQGDSAAQNMLGIMYQNGQGVRQNFRIAGEWYEAAAQKGFARAQYNLGVLYYEGQGVTRNYKTALKWYKLAAEQGDDFAQFNLGNMLKNGDGVPQNYEAAFKWLTRSAEQGTDRAQYVLGVMYATGQFVTRNYKTAFKWFKLAAEKGLAKGQYGMGTLYHRGNGVPLDHSTALKWYNLASNQGLAIAQTNLKKLQKEIAEIENNKESGAPMYDSSVCQRALTGIINPRWETAAHARHAVTEAKSRGFTVQKCFEATGWLTESELAKRQGQTILSNSTTSIATTGSNQFAKREPVFEAQTLLISLGHLHGRADGVAGPKTIAAIKSFQLSQNDAPTGEIDDELVASLKLADQERVTKAKLDERKSLAQLRDERLREEARLAELKIQTKKREKNLAALSQPQPTKNAIPSNINFGEYHALVIGINNYKNLPKLRTAVADAKAIGDVLKTRYGFSVTTLIDPTRAEIFEKLDVLRARLKFSDNLLIYYAGHGWLDKAGNEGYWQPANARNDQQAGWVSNASITTNLRAIKAKHVMVMADSCYSGKLVRGANTQARGIELASINAEASSYLQKMARRKTRVAMTSGNLEPVQDGDKKHSPFARAILQALNENERVIDGIRLFNAILQPVVANTDQTPQYAPIRNAGHSDGSFLFVRRE